MPIEIVDRNSHTLYLLEVGPNIYIHDRHDVKAYQIELMIHLCAVKAEVQVSHLCIIVVIVIFHLAWSYIHPSSFPSLQQSLDIRQPTTLHFISLALLLAKGQTHRLSLVLLNAENAVLNSTLDHKAEDTAVFLLAEPVHTIDSLVLDGRRPPTVGEDDLVRTREVQPNSADAQ